MKNKFFLTILAFATVFAMSSCESDIVFSGQSNEEFTGTIDPGNASLPSTLVVQTLDDNRNADGNSFSINALMNSKPQFVVVTDADNNLLMMYRGILNKDNSINITVQSTAEALVTFHPMFGPVSGEDYARLVQIINQSSHFDALVSAVQNSIASNRNLTDPTNTGLVSALNAVMNDVAQIASTKINAIEEASHCAFGCYPLMASANGNTLELKAPSIFAAYGGIVAKDNATDYVFVPSYNDYNGMTIFDAQCGLKYGTPATITLTEPGNYTISLTRDSSEAVTDLYTHLGSNVLGVLGVNLNQSLVRLLARFIEKDNPVVYEDMDDFDVMNFLARVYSSTEEFLQDQPEGFELWKNWSVSGIMLGQLTNLYQTVSTTAIPILQVTWQLNGWHKDITFNVNYNGSSITPIAR